MIDKRLAIANDLGALLQERQESVAVAESSAGGLISASLLAVPGASQYFIAGSVVYTFNARDVLMGISEREMQGVRSSSEPYASLLATRLIERHGSTWALAETGAAGPTGNRYGDPAGHSCIAVAGPVASVRTINTRSDDRVDNMIEFARLALNELMKRVSA